MYKDFLNLKKIYNNELINYYIVEEIFGMSKIYMFKFIYRFSDWSIDYKVKRLFCGWVCVRERVLSCNGFKLVVG